MDMDAAYGVVALLSAVLSSPDAESFPALRERFIKSLLDHRLLIIIHANNYDDSWLAKVPSNTFLVSLNCNSNLMMIQQEGLEVRASTEMHLSVTKSIVWIECLEDGILWGFFP